MEINATLGRSVVKSTPTLPGHPLEPGRKYRDPDAGVWSRRRACSYLATTEASRYNAQQYPPPHAFCLQSKVVIQIHNSQVEINELLCSCYDLVRFESCLTYCPILVCRVAKWRQSQGGGWPRCRSAALSQYGGGVGAFVLQRRWAFQPVAVDQFVCILST